METNNLTPDENLKSPLNYNPNEDPIRIYDTVEAPGIVFGDAISDEGLAGNGAFVIALLFTVLLAVIDGLLLFYLL